MPDDRTYIKVHDGMPDHPKIDGLSDGAFRLLVTMWCWCSRHLTDGRVPTATWIKRNSKKFRQELLETGLAAEIDGGVVMHDYLEHQRSAAEVADLRDKRRSAGSLGGIAKAKSLANGVANANPVAKQSAKQMLYQTASKSVPETEVYIKPSSSDADAPTRTDVESLCRRLADRIEGNGAKRPKLTDGWRTSARLLMDLDGHDLAEALALIDWCQADDFWRSNILSMPKFRAKYDQLKLRANGAVKAVASTESARPQFVFRPAPEGRDEYSWRQECIAKWKVGEPYADQPGWAAPK